MGNPRKFDPSTWFDGFPTDSMIAAMSRENERRYKIWKAILTNHYPAEDWKEISAEEVQALKNKGAFQCRWCKPKAC